MLVRYRTPWSDPADSWARASRGYARAMRMAGLDVWLDSPHASESLEALAFQTLDSEVEREVEGMLHRPMTWPTTRIVTVLSTTLGDVAHDFDRGLVHFAATTTGTRVLYCTFEREQVETPIVHAMNQLDGVWVPCRWNARTLRDAGVRNVFVAPHVFFDDDPLRQIPPPEHRTAFYWIGRWEPRKAPHNLIRAFLRAFEPGEASLTLKVGPVSWSAGPYPSPEEVLETELKALGREKHSVRVVRGLLSRQEMVRLHAEHDVYVSASRGEGFDLSAFEARLAQRPILTTDSGGPRDFTDANSLLVRRTGSVPVSERGYQWGEGAQWIDYSVEDLARGFVEISEMPPCQRGPLSEFGALSVGCRLKDWFESLKK